MPGTDGPDDVRPDDLETGPADVTGAEAVREPGGDEVATEEAAADEAVADGSVADEAEAREDEAREDDEPAVAGGDPADADAGSGADAKATARGSEDAVTEGPSAAASPAQDEPEADDESAADEAAADEPADGAAVDRPGPPDGSAADDSSDGDVADEPRADEAAADRPGPVDADAADEPADAEVSDEPRAGGADADEPDADEPDADEPADAPVADEAVPDDAVPDEAVADEPAAAGAVAGTPSATARSADDTSAGDGHVAEEPVAEESVAEESVAEESVAGPAAREPDTDEIPLAPARPAPLHRPRERARTRLLEAMKPKLNRGQLLAALLCAGLGFGLVTQIQSTQSGDLSQLSQSDLVQLLTKINGDAERLADAEAKARQERESIVVDETNGKAAEEQLRRRLEVLGILAGTLPATGPGIRLDITDPKGGVDAATLLDALQELRDAGAEAVQINGVRVVASTAFEDLDGGVKVGGEAVRPPYQYLVVGDKATLAAAMQIPGGVLDVVDQKGGKGEVTELDRVDITALHPVRPPQYARPAPDGSP